MGKMISVVYFSLLLFNLVDSSDIRDGHNEDVTSSKHHHHRPRTTANKVAKKKDDDTAANSNTTEEPTTVTEEPKVNIEETITEKLLTDYSSRNSEEHAPENAKDDNFRRSGNIPSRVHIGSATTNLISIDESIGEYFSNSSVLETEKAKAENVDNPTKEAEHINDTEVLDNPDVTTLRQVTVIDLKARSGILHSEEEDPKRDLNLPDVSKIGHSSSLNINSKSGYVPLDEVVVNKPPENVHNYAHHLNRPISYSSDGPLQFKHPYNLRSKTPYNALLNYPRYPPLYFESVSSQELLYPVLNNRENWSQGNTGQRSKSYFNPSYPNNLLNSRYRDRCRKCTQGFFSPREPSLRRSTDETHSVLETANHNGRSVDFDSSGANAYPLVQDKDLEETNHVQSHASPNEIWNPGSQETATQEVLERKVQLSNVQSDLNSFSKLFLPLPSYVPRNSSTLMRRLGLGEVQRYNMN